MDQSSILILQILKVIHPTKTASLTAIDIGQDNQGSRFFNGNIASCQIYNRALTSTEVYNNFVANRGRFGV